MPITLTMPALSPTMEEGTLASWLVAEGDTIEAGDIIAEIETDKATMEYEAPESGILARITVSAGSENVAVNTAIAVLAVDGEDPATIGASDPHEAVLTATALSDPVAPPTMQPVPAIAAETTGSRILISPLARRIAQNKGLDIAAIAGSGPNGRIVRSDVEAAVSSAPKPLETPAPVAASSPVATPSSADVSGLYPEGSYEVIKLDGMRRAIARRLTESKQTVPHFYLRMDVELDALLDLRAQLNGAAPADKDQVPAYKISVNDMVIKALAKALQDVPDANVTWAGDKTLRHSAVDVAVAVAVKGGLITPIIRSAETKSLSAISTEMKDLATRAKERKLAPEEFQGGTTSVSNLGMFGISSFDAVINPPQGTILAVGAGEKRAVVRGDEIAIATVMTVTLSVDHRCVDGALGADLLTSLKRTIESPLTLVV